MSALDLFRYDNHEVHVVLINDEPWFVAGDVARVLEYRDAYNLVRGLDDDERGTHIVSTPGGDQTVAVINEAGLYSAIVRSRAERTKPFKRWITHEVLPAIRKTGQYGAPAALSFEEMTAHVIDGLQQRIADAEQRAKELESPAAAWQGLSSAEGDFTVSDAAKILARDGIATGPRKLYSWLEAHGWVFRRGGRWQAMQSAINAGCVVERVTSGYFDELTGERKQADPQVRILPKGLERLRAELTEERALAVVPS